VEIICWSLLCICSQRWLKALLTIDKMPRRWPRRATRTRTGMFLWNEPSWGPVGTGSDFVQYLHQILEPSEPSTTSPTSPTSFVPARFVHGHLHALAALILNKGKAPTTWAQNFGDVGTRDRGVALQAWLYHLLGGEASGLKERQIDKLDRD